MRYRGQRPTSMRCRTLPSLRLTTATWLAAASQEPDSRRRSELGSLAAVLVDLKDWAPAWKKALKEWNMRESITVNEWKREAVVEALQQTLLMQVRQKFGGVPDFLRQRIEGTTESDMLNRALGQILSATRPEDMVF